MDRAQYYLVAGFLAAILSGCNKPLLNVEKMPIPSALDGSPQSIESVQQAILASCGLRGWSARVVDKGLIEAVIVVREFRAEVQIPFSESHYSILYKDSQGLDYRNFRRKTIHSNFGGETIHGNYNRWVSKLNQGIQRAIGVRSQRF